MQEAIERQGRRPILGVVAGTIFLLIALNTNTDLAIWLALVLRPLMHGVSLFKTNFLLLTILLIALIELLPLRPPRREKVVVLERTIVGSVTAGSIMGFSAFLVLVDRLHLPYDKYAYFFKDGVVSVNQFAHLHVTKPGLYHLVNALGFESITRRADTGLPFGALIHPSVSLGILASAILVLISLVVAAPAVVRTCTGWRRALVLVLFALAGCHLVKCLLDGGPLSYDFLPSLVVVVALFQQAKGEPVAQWIRRFWFTCLCLTIFSLILVALFSPDVALILQPQQYLFFFGLYGLMVLPLLPAPVNSYKRIAVQICIVVWTVLYYHHQTSADLVALYERLDSSAKVTLIDQSNNLDNVVVDTLHQEGQALGTYPIDLYRSTGQHPLRNRDLLIRSKATQAYNGFLFALRILRADSLVQFSPSAHLSIHGVRRVGAPLDSLYTVRIEFDQDLFPTLWEESPDIICENNKFAELFYLDRYLRQHGLSDYVLVPLYYEKTS